MASIRHGALGVDSAWEWKAWCTRLIDSAEADAACGALLAAVNIAYQRAEVELYVEYLDRSTYWAQPLPSELDIGRPPLVLGDTRHW